MTMTVEQRDKFLKNLLKFTAPILMIFFAQLAKGVETESAILVASYALYASLSDYFSKVK